jgi:polyhydroxybutyrate depolymerase
MTARPSRSTHSPSSHSPSTKMQATVAALGFISLGLCGCGPSSDTGNGSGGASSSGGAIGTGGKSPGTGGSSSASGGSPGSGGSASGGSTSGGSNGSGGGNGSGGRGSTGGASTGGSSMGGSSTGGAATGGRGGGGRGGNGGGAPAGGASGTGGGAGAAGTGSPGCMSASPLKSGNFTESIDGTTRKYSLDVPTTYDGTKPYRLIFVWHPLGGNAGGVVNGGYNGLKSLASNSTIFVAPDGLQGSNAEASGNGWWNVNNIDMKFLQAMLTKLNGNLCIDQSRIFSTGFSFGGMMSYTVGYEFNVFRAVAPCSGDLQVIPHKDTYTDPLPIMAFHGNNDTFVTTARGRAARDKYLARNKCGTQTQAVSPSPCVQYQGCAVPTFWCEFSGGHNTWSEEPAAIWKFFSQF